MAERTEDAAGAVTEPVAIPDVLPVLALKDLVIFPFIIVPITVSRESSINAVDAALEQSRVILLAAQKDFQNETPGPDDIYRTGTAALIMRMLKLPDGRIRILVKGLGRARVSKYVKTQPYLEARIEQVEESKVTRDLETEALMRAVKQNSDRAVSLDTRSARAAHGDRETDPAPQTAAA